MGGAKVAVTGIVFINIDQMKLQSSGLVLVKKNLRKILINVGYDEDGPRFHQKQQRNETYRDVTMRRELYLQTSLHLKCFEL